MCLFLCKLENLSKELCENISCHINKQEMSQSSVISGLQMWIRSPKTDPADATTPHGDC